MCDGGRNTLWESAGGSGRRKHSCSGVIGVQLIEEMFFGRRAPSQDS